MTEKPHNFWTSLQGIFTGAAALITALTGLYIAINSSSSDRLGLNDKTDPTDKVVNQNDTGHSLSGAQGFSQPEKLKPPTTKPNTISIPSLVDCSQFPTVNSIKSLMSWSNNYHKKIIAANGDKSRVIDACNKTIEYRAMAHCKDQENIQIRQALLETLALCSESGVEWDQVKHSGSNR